MIFVIMGKQVAKEMSDAALMITLKASVNAMMITFYSMNKALLIGQHS